MKYYVFIGEIYETTIPTDRCEFISENYEEAINFCKDFLSNLDNFYGGRFINIGDEQMNCIALLDMEDFWEINEWANPSIFLEDKFYQEINQLRED